MNAVKTALRRVLSALLCAALLAACSPAGPDTATPEAASASMRPPEASEQTEPATETVAAVYTPPEEGLSLQETVEAYFEQQYLSYCTFTDIDLSAILDMSETSARNSARWTQLLNQRRRLLREHDLCYVETEAFPYQIQFLEAEELEDPRMEFWSGRLVAQEGGVYVHFVIRGEPGRAYPPILAVNAQHTMMLVEKDGGWKIDFHYFPGAIRKFLRGRELEIPSDETMLAALREEFAATTSAPASALPAGAAPYRGEAAVEYARLYTETHNEAFYNIGDWMGNCANFTSQCVWYGFREAGADPSEIPEDSMSGGWYAGEGGGSPAWENVERFWQHITEGRELGGRILPGVRAVEAGDLIQTLSLAYRPADGEEEEDAEERFNHSLLVVESETLLLAQNSPDCFVYYSDIVNVISRFIRPAYFAG